jgi:hypothetical protein
MNILSYLFWPNPGNADYSSPKVVAALAVSVLLLVIALTVRYWRNGLNDPMLKKLSRSWVLALISFGLVGIVLVVSRVEHIQFMAMRALWIVWIIAFVWFLWVQWISHRMRYYQIIPQERTKDPRDKYLPKKGNRR